MKIVLQWSFRFFFYPPSRVFAYHSSARDNLSNCGHALMTDVSLSLSACVVCTCVSLEDRFLFFFWSSDREQTSGTTSPTLGHAYDCSAIPYNNAALQSTSRVPCAAAKNVRHFVGCCQEVPNSAARHRALHGLPHRRVERSKCVYESNCLPSTSWPRTVCRIKYTTSRDNNTRTLLTSFFILPPPPLSCTRRGKAANNAGVILRVTYLVHRQCFVDLLCVSTRAVVL